jgi:hypothetical protein
MSFSSGDDRLSLVGLSVEKTPTEVILYLHWKADVHEQRPYVLSMIPVLPDGSTGAGLNWNPADWNYPPTCWVPGEEFVDPVHIALGDPVIPGDWAFSLSVLDAFTQERMFVIGPDGVGVDQQLGLGPVTIESVSAQN